ncbi:hypothetical protein FEP63_05154 [Burkholderia multivorans]|nr:hypothetical protein [Burkholderia multivorans]MDR8882465.1 hypothetical protein [Burkholderia multivorans]MDR8889474.1 hypothetical protein [Burkholderia multivorans]MDR8908228.1 hypothetical protein [Burkholderia multivorans]MDR8915107.1 hypothetical protein [Burkholderia multivorans]
MTMVMIDDASSPCLFTSDGATNRLTAWTLASVRGLMVTQGRKRDYRSWFERDKKIPVLGVLPAWSEIDLIQKKQTETLVAWI